MGMKEAPTRFEVLYFIFSAVGKLDCATKHDPVPAETVLLEVDTSIREVFLYLFVVLL